MKHFLSLPSLPRKPMHIQGWAKAFGSLSHHFCSGLKMASKLPKDSLSNT